MLCLGTVSETGDAAAAVRLREFIGATRLFQIGMSKGKGQEEEEEEEEEEEKRRGL